MKKIFALLFAMCLMASLTACGEQSEEEKTILAIDEIAEEEYTGTLSECSYETGDEIYTIALNISPSDIKVTIKDGEMTIYNEAACSAAGNVSGVETPHSPEYTQIASGTLTLEQKDEKIVCAEGKLDALGDIIYIHWDGDKHFTNWSTVPNSGTYPCTVNITMKDGIPVADIKLKAKYDKRTCDLPLKLKNEAAN